MAEDANVVPVEGEAVAEVAAADAETVRADAEQACAPAAEDAPAADAQVG